MPKVLIYNVKIWQWTYQNTSNSVIPSNQNEQLGKVSDYLYQATIEDGIISNINPQDPLHKPTGEYESYYDTIINGKGNLLLPGLIGKIS